MKTRKSKMCVAWCKEKGCYDTYEKKNIYGKWYWVWISHCKAREKMHNKIIKNHA